jgi:predicted unusual protein kinase regulating ubiquinone biosynthesis (AarF/ABC1/UbiB family)
VQRPDIEKLIRADLEILFFLARLLKAHVAESRRFDPLGLWWAVGILRSGKL